MRLLRSSALKDLRRQVQDPWSLLLSLAIPLVVGGLLVLAFGRDQGPAPRAHLLVADEDRSLVSGLLVQALGRAGVIEVETVARAEARRRLEAGGATAMLVVPAGFGGAVLDDQPVTLQLVTNPAQRILPGIVEQTLRILVDGAFYARRLLGEPLRELRGGAPSDATVARVSVAVNQILQRAGPYLFPPALAIEPLGTAANAPPAPRRGLGAIFFPGMLFMALLFVTQAQSADIWRERQQGTLRRALTTPGGVGPLLGGKLVAGTMVLGTVSLAALAFAALALGLAWSALPLAWLWCVFSGAVFLAVMILLQVHGSSPRGASMLITIVIFPLLMIGGSFFPFEAMPPGLAAIGRRTPNGWALSQLQAIFQGTARPGGVLAAFALLAAVGTLALGLSARRLRRSFAGA
ncbi:MAG TPA: ABC transporter permease [Vicinamibacteria bacterium]